MITGKINSTSAHLLVQQIVRDSAKSGHQTLTSLRPNKYIIRTDLNNGTYGKTMLILNNKGTVSRAYTMLMKKAAVLKNKLAAFL